MHGDWIVAIASILAAILGGVTIYLLDRYRAGRKSLRFTVERAEAISDILRAHGAFFEIKIGTRTTQELNLAGIALRNSGNLPVENLEFEVIIPGTRSLFFAEAACKNEKLKQAIRIDSDYTQETDPRFGIRLSYFNPGESFQIKTFYDGPPTSCKVACRLPAVTTRIDTAEAVERRAVFVGKIMDRAPIGIAFAALLVGFLTFWFSPTLPFFVDSHGRLYDFKGFTSGGELLQPVPAPPKR